MENTKKSRTEIFKKDIEESKQYHSIERVAKANSSLLSNKKEFLKDLDEDYFKEDIEVKAKTIKPLEKSKLLDYHLSLNLKEIQKSLTQNKFDIPPRAHLITKINFRDDIKEIYNKVHQHEKTFQSDFDFHQINFNKKISELDKLHEEIEAKKLQDFDLEMLEEKSVQEEVFEKTQGHKFALTKPSLTKINPETNTKEIDTQKLYYIVLIFGLLLIWFIRR